MLKIEGNKIEIIINGVSEKVNSGFNLQSLLFLKGFRDDYYAVALNGAFIARSLYEKVEIKKDDKIEIVTPMQGG